MILKVTAAAKALLATSFISLAGAQSNYTFSTVPVVDGSAETVREVVHDSTIPNTLIISYSTMAAETAIDSEIEKQKKQGMNVSVKGKTKFKTPQRPITAHPGNSNKNKGNKGKNRYLESSDDILGFTTVITSSENVDDEVNILSGIAGVTSVEHDVELSILDVPGLRGRSVQDQINDIMDAVAMEQVCADVLLPRLQITSLAARRHLSLSVSLTQNTDFVSLVLEKISALLFRVVFSKLESKHPSASTWSTSPHSGRSPPNDT